MKKLFLILAAIAMLTASAVPLMAQEQLPPDPNLSGRMAAPPEGEFIMFDVFILRPLGLFSMGVGALTAAAASPWAASSHSMDMVQRELLDKPFNYTFRRPVGDIDF